MLHYAVLHHATWYGMLCHALLCHAVLCPEDAAGDWTDVRMLAAEYQLCLEIMVNHISPASEQYQSLLKHGRECREATMFTYWYDIWGPGEGVAGVMAGGAVDAMLLLVHCGCWNGGMAVGVAVQSNKRYLLTLHEGKGAVMWGMSVITWTTSWMLAEGPNADDLAKVRTRKPGPPLLVATLEDGSQVPLWCTFGEQQVRVWINS